VDAGREEMVEFLLGRGADVSHRAGFALFASATPLLRATLHGHTRVAEILLEHGAKIEARDKHGRTALFKACGRGYRSCARMLLEGGAHVDTTESKGVTALMSAAAKNRTGCVRLLLEHGADVSAEDKWGRTALGTAKDVMEAAGDVEGISRLDPRILQMLRTARERAETAAGAQ
jgi:26S proteasome non-ATPase regulatory subunit 10